MARTIVKTLSIAALLSATSLVGVQAAAQDTARTASSVEFAKFAPSPDRKPHRIDYSLWTDAMRSLVISMGPSTRTSAGTEASSFGTRRRYGHNSRYRLEGTRLMFSQLDNDAKAGFSAYRQDLESVGNSLDIRSLPRNEQLAYWLNLHNVAMVEQIALAWPVRQPRSIEIGGVPLDEAKFITVAGTTMSLKDIRTQIIYPNWKDPRVIYGLWRGDIGSPSLQREAFDSENLDRLLDRGAKDLVNSLRGTQKNGSTLLVSTIFAEAAPFYFGNFEALSLIHI